ncbi:crotonobetaine/carnitine-CoA ligase [Amycolatopsis sulphurea]|uniref:Crotonobetaine/carnitine-CoA ligase n=1 Tax=Amycolatopsis sulphurea TaxID=76022 RepID=A0A2A9FCR8_9PSEU|nr:AMP-binding protein [Amycolatopsis sulphurea]PFG49227.1 crotonobetaine/carnitine-CoA ligase [Amycolatopsis sulphurea]
MAEILTLPEFLREGVQKWPDKPWLHTPEGTTTRAALYADALRCLGGLRGLGVEPGDHVVIVLPNGQDFLRAWFAAGLCGAVSIAVNPQATSELPAVVKDTGAKLVVVPADFTAGDLGGVPVTTVAELKAAEPADPVVCAPESPATYIQSSGSTGRPKFIIETHGMYTMAAEGYPYWLGLTEDDVCLTTLPLSHLNAQAYSTLGTWGNGAELVLLPKFSASTFWETVHRYGVTVFNAIGAMIEILMEREPSSAERGHKLRYAYSAPAPVEARHKEIEERFGLRLAIGYALSETPYGLIVPLDEPPAYGSMGRPRQHPRFGRVNEARIIGPDGAEVPAGQTGELQLRNPALSPGYFGLPDETRALRSDGWLHTGDLAYADAAGNLYFAGRLKEIIRRRGENLSPADVEVVLDAHPAVSSSAVIGVPSPLSEEDVKAFVLRKPDTEVGAGELAAWAAKRLPPYKRPRYLEFVESWPLTETHKIAKRLLPTTRTANEVDFDLRSGA